MSWYWYFHLSPLKARYRLKGLCYVSCCLFVYTIAGNIWTTLLQIYEATADEPPTRCITPTVILYVSARANITFITSEQLKQKAGYHLSACLGIIFELFILYNNLNLLMWFLPLSPTFISSLPIKHGLSAHFAWRHLIACCWGTSPNRLSAGSYSD